MPYPAGHRAAVKRNIIDSARKLFNRHGFESVSLSQIMALAIGGMVVARTIVDRALADQLRAACMAVALDLGGWDKKRKAEDGKSKRSQPRRGILVASNAVQRTADAWFTLSPSRLCIDHGLCGSYSSEPDGDITSGLPTNRSLSVCLRTAEFSSR
jgi:hypothetical protein